jgi:hypothetical protein
VVIGFEEKKPSRGNELDEAIPRVRPHALGDPAELVVLESRRMTASPKDDGYLVDGLIEHGIVVAHERSPLRPPTTISPLSGRAGVWWM